MVEFIIQSVPLKKEFQKLSNTHPHFILLRDLPSKWTWILNFRNFSLQVVKHLYIIYLTFCTTTYNKHKWFVERSEFNCQDVVRVSAARFAVKTHKTEEAVEELGLVRRPRPRIWEVVAEQKGTVLLTSRQSESHRSYTKIVQQVFPFAIWHRKMRPFFLLSIALFTFTVFSDNCCCCKDKILGENALWIL